VLDGNVLLHESPFGYDEPMRGRYAFVADSPGHMREGIERLGVVLRVANRTMTRVVSAPDRASRVLGLAAAKILGLPFEEWTKEGKTHGLYVAWNLSTVEDGEFLAQAQHYAADRVLFAHAADWVDPFSFAPDVTTFLCQTVTHPYVGGALIAGEGGNVAPAPPDTRSDAELVAEIASTAVSEEGMTKLAQVEAIVSALMNVETEYATGLYRTSGVRLRQRAGSPVSSARFG